MFWDLCHLVSFAYPEQPTTAQREQTARFYESLSSVLPCEECKTDYASLLRQFPVRDYLDSRDRLSRWCYDLHNRVNVKLGKPITVSYEQARARYSRFSPEAAQCQQQLVECKSTKKRCGSSALILAIAILAILVP